MTAHLKMWLVLGLLMMLVLIVGTVEAHAIYPPPHHCRHAQVCIQVQPPPQPPASTWSSRG